MREGEREEMMGKRGRIRGWIKGWNETGLQREESKKEKERIDQQ